MNTVKLLFCLLVLVYPSVSWSQSPFFHGDARSLGMANTMVMLSGTWSGLNNAAGLAGIRSTSFGIFYENYFGIPELGTGAFSCSIHTRSGNFGAGFTTSGFSQLRQNQATISYGRTLGSKIRAGVGIHWLVITQPAGYTNLSAVIPSMGVQFLPSEKLTAGISVFNPACQQYNPSGYLKIPRGFQAGIGYHFGKELLICLETEKLTGEKPHYFCGMEVSLQKKVCFRLGISKQNVPGFSCGIGYLSKLLSIDAALTRHPVLGFNSALGLTCAIQ